MIPKYEFLNDTPLGESFLMVIPKERNSVEGVAPIIIRLLEGTFNNWIVTIENLCYNEVGNGMCDFKFNIVPILIPKNITDKMMDDLYPQLEKDVKMVVMDHLEEISKIKN